MEAYKELLNLIKQLSHSRDCREVFTDFMEITAITISNSVDKLNFTERENQYLNTMKKYTPEHQKLFPEMLSRLVIALGNAPFDVLGKLFYELGLPDKNKSQIFTPQHIADMMGALVLSNDNKTISEQGFISFHDSCCGSGVLSLGFANAMGTNGYNYCNQMLATAVDIDLRCVYMSYIQLSLYGIPAIVIHGSALTMEEYSRWFTPTYILGNWQRKVAKV